MPDLKIFFVAVLGGAVLAHTGARAEELVTFRISIESVTGPETLALPDGAHIAAPISPGLFVVSPDDGVFFQPDGKASSGLERLAEDGNPEPLINELNAKASRQVAFPFLHNQDFTVSAKPGDRLYFAVMFAQSNDLFYAPGSGGIQLFLADGRPASGEVTTQVTLWDAGTETNQAPGTGSDQAPRQVAPNTGPSEPGLVGLVTDGFTYPATAEVIRVTVSPEAVAAPVN